MDAVAVIGGGGGAGATTVVAGLAGAFAALGRRVATIDADLGLGNLDAVLGVRSERGLGDVIAGHCSLPEALLAMPDGIRVVAAGRFARQSHALTPEERQRLIDQIDAIAPDVDVLLIDAGAGLAPNTAFFAGAAQRVVLVATPAPDVQQKTLAILTALSSQLPKASVYLLINRTRTVGEARNAFASLVRMTEPTLCADLHYLGCLPLDEDLAAAPSTLRRRSSWSGEIVRGLAVTLDAQMFLPNTGWLRGGAWLCSR